MDDKTIQQYLHVKRTGENYPKNFNGGNYTPRERFNRWMHFKSVDHVPHEEFNFWKETFARWYSEGLPRHVYGNAPAEIYFQFDRRDYLPVIPHHYPMFTEEVLEESEQYKIVIDDWGVKCKIHRMGESSIPHFIAFPIQNKQDFAEFRKRLDSGTPGRFPEDWDLRVERWKGRDFPLGYDAGSLFGWIRNWMGFEGISYALYDDISLVLEIMDTVTELMVALAKKVIAEVDIDFVRFWEDMAFKTAPMISPKMFKEFMVPRYKKITSVFLDKGIDVIYVDCDGNINELVELWMEAGIPGMFPLEIGSESDPVKLREKYGESVLLLGGIDKKTLIAGKTAIEKEILRIEKTVQTGGYIPHLDHLCPPDVSFENYQYYLKLKKKMLGIAE